jgi:diacylglycerol kinase family enzyme
MHKMKHALVVYNPVSGRKKWGDIPSLLEDTLERNGYEWTWVQTRPDLDLLPYLKKKFDRIVVSGGDGTVAMVADALLRAKVKTPLVIIPQGSANVLAVTLGLPMLSPGRALENGLNGRTRRLDLMWVNQKRVGLIAVGRGYDAFLMQETPRELKRKLGFFAYAWTFLKTALFYGAKPYKLTVDGVRTAVVARSILVLNLLPIPFLPIKPDDGLLNVVVLTSKGLIEYHTGKKISIKASHEFSFQLDGEVLKDKNVNVEVLPSALTLAL